MFGNVLKKFQAAQAIAEAADRGKVDAEEAVKALRYFDEVVEWVRSEQVFAPGETIEDVKTEYIPFVAVPYYVYLIQVSAPAPPGVERTTILTNAKLLGEAFMEKLAELGTLDKEDGIYYGAKDEDRLEMSPTEKRNTAVRLFREEKELLSNLDSIKAKIFEKTSGEDMDDRDEDLRRAFGLTLLRVCAKKYLSSLSTLNQELEILTYMKSSDFKRDQDRIAEEDAAVDDSMPRPGIETIYIPKLDKKLEIQDKAMKPFGTQPIPLDDYEMLKRELRDEGVLHGTGEKEIAEKKDRDEMEEDDTTLYDTVKVYEARDWDDFKDDNPTGWGNRPGRV